MAFAMLATLHAAGAQPAARRDTIALEGVEVSAVKQTAGRGADAASSVVHRHDIERNGIATVRDVSGMVPNFFIPDYGSRMTSTIYVRGLGARIDNPSMGLNIDNVPVMCKENYDFDVLDMERVEMLRGPQGTLYGRNAMGGLMNITTLSPMTWQGTRLLAEGASHSSFKAGASHYARPSRQWAFMAGAYFTTTAGQFRNQFNGKLVDWERQGSGRIKVEWRPRESLAVSNTLSLSVSRQGGYPYEYVPTGQITYNDTCFYRRTAIIDGLTVTKRWDAATLSAVTSYQYLDDNMTLDQDFTPLPYFTLTQARREHAVTQEVVARGHDTRPYRWVAGTFGFYRRYRMDAPVTFKDTGIARLIEDHVNDVFTSYPIEWDTRSFVLGSRFTCPTWGVALYHQSSYRWRRWLFTAGLRLDYERSSLHYRSTTHTGYRIVEAATGSLYRHDNIDIDENGRLAKDFVQLLPKLSVTFNIDNDNSVSLSLTKGYKAGGFNTQMFSDVLQQRLMGLMGIGASYDVDKIVGYKPEVAWNYELGGRFALWNKKLKLQLNAFYIDCRDRQLTTFPDGTTTGRVMTNAGKTRSAGVEAQVQLQPVDDLQLTASYGYCDARFVEYNDGKADYKDKWVPYCPASTLWAQALYIFKLNAASDWWRTLTLDAHVQGAGAIHWNEANTMRQPFYALLGAGVTLAGKHYTLQLWGRNLTGTAFNTFHFVSISHDFLQRGRGRSLGCTLRVTL